jgi:hypothetical protein
MRNIVNKISSFMNVASFVIIHADKRMTLTFIRNLSSNVPYSSYDTDIIIFLDRAYFKDEFNAALINSDNFMVVKPIMDTKYLETTRMLDCPHSEMYYWVETSWSKDLIYRKLQEIYKKSNTIFLNFEIFDKKVLEFLKTTTKHKLTFCHTGKLDGTSIYDTADWENRMKRVRTSLMNLLEPRKMIKASVLVDEVINDINDLSTYVSKEAMEWTEEIVAKYLYSRHEVMVRTIQLMLDLDLDDSDVDIRKRFAYRGVDSHLTPDLVFFEKDTGKIYLIDVAVTRGNTRVKSDQKETKYSLLADQLSIHMSTDVIACSAVFSSTDSEDRISPDFLRDFNEDISLKHRDLVHVEEMAMEQENYMEAVRSYETKMNMDEVATLNNDMRAFNDSYLALKDFSDHKASDLKDSFLKESCDFKMNMTTVSADDMINKIRDDYKNFDELTTMREMVEQFDINYKSGNYPITIEKVFKEMKLEPIRVKMVEDAEITRKEYMMKNMATLPKMFKFPDMTMDDTCEAPEVIDDLGCIIEMKDDGTRIHRDYSEVRWREKVENRSGMGFSMKKDSEMMMDCLEFMTDESSLEFRQRIGEEYSNPRIREMSKLKIFEIAYKAQKLAWNIAYMEGRRVIFGSSKTVSKTFSEDRYCLAIRRGSRLTVESQILYKVFTINSNSDCKFFHEFEEDDSGFCQTNWLAMSSSDLKTMLSIFDKCVAIASLYLDAIEESRKSKAFKELDVLKSEMVIMPLLITMEMKRGTSTTCQYNRYILNSMLGFVSDKEKAFKDIMADPIRSQLEAYIRISQIKWALRLESRSKSIWMNGLLEKMSTASDYDKLYAPAIYGGEEDMEFVVHMNDIYHGNLFEKESGFSSHRSKAIVEKTMEAEKEFLENRNMDNMNANLTMEDTFHLEDRKHHYSKEFMMLMGKKAAKKLKEHPDFQKTILKGLTETCHGAMMMTYSLKEARVVTETLEWSEEQKTTLSFLTIDEIIDEFGTASLYTIVSKMNIIEAIFSMFPKAQIGGPREILIQSYRLRLHVKFLENMFEGFCKLHEKEMLTKGAMKEKIQSNTASMFKKDAANHIVRNKRFALLSTLVADASRWAPSFVMHMFLHFLIAMELPRELEDHFILVLKSFSSKLTMLPKALKRKWEKKPEEEVEANDLMEWVRDITKDSEFCLRVFSGMGQGMLHRMSSLIHCMKDDVMEDMIRYLLVAVDPTYDAVTMISSDDLMKQMMMTSKNVKDAFVMNHMVMCLYECTNMLSNIHTNWKKTSLSFLIEEFNSYFTTGKRATMAVIKDVFTAMSIVDFTEPSKAVSMVVSNISRAFYNGLFIETSKVMFNLMRRMLMNAYAIKEHVVDDLCEVLDCRECELPAELGFLDERDIVGQMIFGKEIMMFKSTNSATLNSFYRALFTGIREDVREMVDSNIIESTSGKIRLVLPYRVDKAMAAIKEDYFASKNIDMEEVMEFNEDCCLFLDLDRMTKTFDRKMRDNYFVGMQRTYRFGDSMVVHSLVRALQYGSTKLMMRPSVISERECDIMSFVHRILERTTRPSSIKIYEPYSKMMEEVEKAMLHCKSAVKSDAGRHTKKCKIRFRTRNLVMRADVDEVMEFVAGYKDRMSNRLITVLEDLAEMLSLDKEDFISDPLKEINKKMSSYKYPMTTFKLVLDEYVQNRINYSVDLMCGFNDGSSAFDSLCSIICERMNPSYSMTVKKESNFSTLSDDINTWISLGGNSGEIPWDLMTGGLEDAVRDTAGFINTSDTAFERGAKLLYCADNSIQDIKSDFVFHRRGFTEDRAEYHCWTNLDDTCLMMVDHENCTLQMTLSNKDGLLDENSAVFRLMSIEKSSIVYSNFKAYYNDGGVYSTEMACNRNSNHYKLSIRHLVDRFEIYINMNVETYDNNEPFNASFKVFSNNYTITSTSLARMNSNELVKDFYMMTQGFSNLKTIQEIMKKNNLTDEPVLGRWTDDRNKNQKGDDMTKEAITFSADMSVEDLIKGMKLSSIDEEMEFLTDKLAEINSTDNIMETFDGVNFEAIEAMMQNAFVDDISEVDPWERASVNLYIRNAVQEAFYDEYEVSRKKLATLFNTCTTQEDFDRAWSQIATDIHLEAPEIDDFLIRILLIIIYRSLAGKMSIKAPKMVSIIVNRKRFLNPIVTKIEIDEYESAMMHMG